MQNNGWALIAAAFLLMTTVAFAVPKKLIEYGWDVPTPSFVAQHIREMEERPFDGLIMRVPNIGSVFENRKWDRAEVAGELAALAAIRWEKFTDNFICMYAASSMDWCRDADWENVLHNVGLCAEAARLGRCRGVCFDAEPYGENPWYYPKQAHAGEKSFADYCTVVRRRGAQFMARIQEELPSPVVHTFFLLSLFGDDQDLADNQYGLLPSFLNGMLDAATPGTIITDGNESSYYYTDGIQYVKARRAILRAGRGPLVAAGNRGKYRAQLQCSQALYVDHLFDMRTQKNISAYMTPEQRARWFEHNVFWALTTSDRYVWLYSEKMSWWKNEGLPPGLEQAVISARAKVAAGKPLGFDLAPIIRRTREQEAAALASGLQRRRAQVPMLAAGVAPVIDGRLEDPAWGQAAALEPFVAPFSSPADSVTTRTTAWLAYDRQCLYVAVRCQEPAMDKLRLVGTKRDQQVWLGDSVDVFVGPGPGKPYYHLIFNPANVAWDARCDRDEDLAWNPRYRSATFRGPDYWTLELALPWSALKLQARPGTTLVGNLCRQRGSGELSTWSQTVSMFVEPEHFGAWELR